MHEYALRVVQPDPGRDSLGSLDAEALRQPREFELRIDELGGGQRDGVEPVLVPEHLREVGVGQLATHRRFHEEYRVGPVDAVEDGGGVDVQGEGSIDGANSHRRRGRGVEIETVAGPVVPGKRGRAGSRGPEVGRYVDVEIASVLVVERRYDDVLIPILGNVLATVSKKETKGVAGSAHMQNFPSTVIFDACPSRCLPNVLELPVERTKLAFGHAASAAVELNLRAVKVCLKDLSNMAPSREVGNRVSLVWKRIVALSGCGHLVHPSI